MCCVYCDSWVDKPCDDPDCPFCANRPDTPSEALFYEELFYQEECGRMEKEYRRKNYQHKDSGAKKHQMQKEEYQMIMENREIQK